jgi:riboflavin synthase
MFTGIIEELGTVESVEPREAGARLRIRCATVLSDAVEGCSICVNGVCLTAIDLRPDSFAADLAPETLRASSLGGLRAGSRVNLERSLAAGGRLSGHIVQGHVDAAAEFLGLDPLGSDNWYKGSVAIDGISLTVASMEGDVLSVTIVPHTFRNTALGSLKPGDRVNIECDIVAKYVDKLLGRIELPGGLTMEKLKDLGY